MSTVAIGAEVPGGIVRGGAQRGAVRGVAQRGGLRDGAQRGAAVSAGAARVAPRAGDTASAPRALRLVPVAGDPVPAGPGAVLRLTTRGRAVLVVLVAVLITLTGLVTGRAFAGSPASALEVESYVVQTGDTLWQLAAERTGPGQDVRDVVLELQRLNALPQASLTAGERIVLPVDL